MTDLSDKITATTPEAIAASNARALNEEAFQYVYRVKLRKALEAFAETNRNSTDPVMAELAGRVSMLTMLIDAGTPAGFYAKLALFQRDLAMALATR